MSTLNYAQQALGIKNKKQESSIKLVGGGGGGLSSYSANLSSTPAASGISSESWNDMECKLSYMENQVAEAQSMLGRKHEAMQAAVSKVTLLENTIDAHKEAKEDALAQLQTAEDDKEQYVHDFTIFLF